MGEYVILHVRANFFLSSFRYVLLSKGCIVEAGMQAMEVRAEELGICVGM